MWALSGTVAEVRIKASLDGETAEASFEAASRDKYVRPYSRAIAILVPDTALYVQRDTLRFDPALLFTIAPGRVASYTVKDQGHVSAWIDGELKAFPTGESGGTITVRAQVEKDMAEATFTLTGETEWCASPPDGASDFFHIPSRSTITYRYTNERSSRGFNLVTGKSYRFEDNFTGIITWDTDKYFCELGKSRGSIRETIEGRSVQQSFSDENLVSADTSETTTVASDVGLVVVDEIPLVLGSVIVLDRWSSEEPVARWYETSMTTIEVRRCPYRGPWGENYCATYYLRKDAPPDSIHVSYKKSDRSSSSSRSIRLERLD